MSLDLIELLINVVSEGNVSDVFIVAGTRICLKCAGEIKPYGDSILSPEDTAEYVHQIYELAGNRDMSRLLESGDDDFSLTLAKHGRFRCNAYKQRGSLAAVLRVVAFSLPDYHVLGIPETVVNLYKENKGLVLVTGPAGSGKSTTLSCIVDKINNTRNNHIITIEDPIEFLHRHSKSIISQREVDHDTETYASALRAALRQAPNVILVGEMRDFDTVTISMTAAETGQLVLSTLHTVGAANTIDRIIDVFPPSQQHQIMVQLSMVLQAVVSQRLIPTVDGKVVPAFEIMKANSAIRNLIRDSKIHQIDNVIYSSASEGMISMDTDILRLYTQGIISKENAIFYATNPSIMQKKISD